MPSPPPKFINLCRPWSIVRGPVSLSWNNGIILNSLKADITSMKNLFFLFKNMMGQRSGKLSEKWDFNSQSVVLASPIAVDGDDDGMHEIVFGSKDGKVYALDGSAKVKWMYDSRENFSANELMFIDADTVNSINSPPNVADINGDGRKELVFGSESGNVYALDNRGQLLWKTKIGSPIRGGICIHNL